MATIKDTIQLLESDPKFAELTYGAQLEVRAKLYSEALKDDGEFLKLEPAAQTEVFNKLVFARPTLMDKALSAQSHSLVQAAQKGDVGAKKIMSNMVASSALIGNSIIAGYFGTKIIAPSLAAEKNVALTPELESSQFWAAAPGDRVKLVEYFESVLAPDKDMARRTKLLKIAATVLPTITEMLLMTLPVVGTSAAPIRLGAVATKGIQNLGYQLAAKGSAWGATAMKVLSGATHASLTAGIGVVRENLLELIRDGAKDEGFQETLKKNAKWFGGYYLWDVVGNIALDTMLPLLGATVKPFMLGKMGQNAPMFKGLEKGTLSEIIQGYLAGRDIDPYLMARLPKPVQLAMDNLRTAYAVNRNLPIATKSQLFTFMANTKGYIVDTGTDGSVALRAVATGDVFTRFRTPEAGVAWLVQNWQTPGAGRVLKPIKSLKADDARLKFKGTAPSDTPWNMLTKDPSVQLKDFTYDGMPLSPANLTRNEWRDYLKKRSLLRDGTDPRIVAWDEMGNEYMTTKYGVDALKDRDAFVQTVLKRNNIDPATVRVVWDGTPDGSEIGHIRHFPPQEGSSIRHEIDLSGSGPNAKYPEFRDQLALTIEHEVEHIVDYEKGWGYVLPLSGQRIGTEPHHAYWHNYDIDGFHEKFVKETLGEGYGVPWLESDYPNLLPYQFRVAKVVVEDLPAYTAASKHVELRRVLKNRLQVEDSNALKNLAKLAAPDPTTLRYNRENMEQFAREYMRLSGAEDWAWKGISVKVVHSRSVVGTGDVATKGELLEDAVLQFRRSEAASGVGPDILEIPLQLKGREYLDEIMNWLDSYKASAATAFGEPFPVKLKGPKWGRVEFRPAQKWNKYQLKIQKTGKAGQWTVESMIPVQTPSGVQMVPVEVGMLEKSPAGLWEVITTRRRFEAGVMKTERMGTVGAFPSLKIAREALQAKLEQEFVGAYAKGKLQGVYRAMGSDVFAELGATGKAWTKQDLVKDISEILWGKKTPVRVKQTLAEKGFGAKYPQLLGEMKIYTPAWMDYVTKNLYGTVAELDQTSGKWILDVLEDPANAQSKVVQRMTFDTHQDVGLMVLANTVDDAYMQTYLNSLGMGLRKNKSSGMYEIFNVRTPDEVLFSDKSVKDLLLNNSEIMPKIPHDLGPQMTLVAPGMVEVTYSNGGVAVGTVEQLLKEGDKFENRAIGAQKKLLGVTKQGYLIGDQASQSFEVFIPELGDRMYFSTMEEAKAWLKGGFDSLENIEAAALKKGWRLTPENGKWVVYDSVGKAEIFNTMADVKARMATVPIPSWMPELSGMPSEMVEPWKKIIRSEGMFPPTMFEVKPNQTKFQLQLETLNQFISSPEGWLMRHVSKGGDPELLKIFRKVEDLRQLVRGQDNRLNQIAHTLFLDEGSKNLMKLERRKYIGEWLRAKGDEAKKAVIAARGLTDYELGVGAKVRELWGVEPGKGLHGRYLGLAGGSGVGWLEDYLPKLTKHYLSHKSMRYADGSFNEFFRDVYGKNVPRDLDAFFMHQRVYDILTLLDEEDPLALLMKYGKVGNRKFILGQYWDQAMKDIDASTDAIGAARMRYYMGDVMGLPQTAGESIMKNASLEALRRFGVNKGMGEDLLRFFMSTGYMSALGLRPMLAVRNMMQIWTTTAPSLGADGNKWVRLALKKIAADKSGQVFDAFRAKGLFMAELPAPGGELFEAFGPEGIAGKFMNAGMKWYRNSDELSRAVAYWAARMKFENASDMFRSGMTGKGARMSEEAFLEMSGLRATDPTFMEDTLRLVRDGNWVSAADAYATRMTTWTMFPYWSGMSPMSFRGTMGKLFGMMGHYPVYYIENIRRNLKFGSPASKAAFMATWAYNSAALYGAFTMLGLKANDFLPWQPAQFVGGPYYQLANGLLASIGTGYKARQARAELFGFTTSEGQLKFEPQKGQLYKWFIPFSYEMSNLVQAWKYADEGNTWAAFLSVTGGRPTPYWTGEQ